MDPYEVAALAIIDRFEQTTMGWPQPGTRIRDDRNIVMARVNALAQAIAAALREAHQASPSIEFEVSG